MKNASLWVEVFYSPKSFFRLRKNDPGIKLFLSIFPIITYSILISYFAWVFHMRLNVLQFSFALIVFYAGGLVKACLYAGVINWNQQRVSVKDMWLMHSIGLYPILLLTPILVILSEYQGIIVLCLMLIIIITNIVRVSLIRTFIQKETAFVWVISLTEGIFILSILVLTLGGSWLVLLELFKGVFSQAISGGI